MPMPGDRNKATEISFNSGKFSKMGGMSAPQDIGELTAPHRPLPQFRRPEEALPKKSKRKKPRGKHHRLKIAMKSFAALLVLVLIVGGFFFAKGYLKLHKVLKGGGEGAAALNKDVDPFQLKGEGDGRVNILMLGKGGPGHDGPDLTDTILVASIDPIAKEAALLSVPRDLYVKTPTGGSSKINAIYANAKYAVLNRSSKKTADVNSQTEKAGIDAIEKTVSADMGIPIHYYVMVDFEAFRSAIDTVGGIDINVTEQLYDPTVAWENNNNPVIAKVGLDHMGGKQALLYARSRHGSARGDFDRTERQREILMALKTKIMSTGTLANPVKLNGLMDAFGNHVSTDLGLNDVSRLYDIGKDIDGSKVQSIGLADPPNNYVTTDFIDNQSVVIPRKGIYNFSDIQSYIRNTLRDSFLKSENARIVILNGTNTPGLATKESDLLKSYGYNVTQTGTAPTANYDKTVLVDLTNGTKKYTKNYLEKRVSVSSTTTMPDSTIDTSNADFVIILGSNETATNSN
jgi:LCP family protein required for cell wall assembly